MLLYQHLCVFPFLFRPLRLGHKDVKITLEVYAHVSRKAKAGTVELISFKIIYLTNYICDYRNDYEVLMVNEIV